MASSPYAGLAVQVIMSGQIRCMTQLHAGSPGIKMGDRLVVETFCIACAVLWLLTLQHLGDPGTKMGGLGWQMFFSSIFDLSCRAVDGCTFASWVCVVLSFAFLTQHLCATLRHLHAPASPLEAVT